MQVYELCDKWLSEREGFVRISTLQNYEYAIRRFKRYFEDTAIEKLSASDVASAFRKMADDNFSYSSIYNVRQVLRAIYRNAICNGLTASNPFNRAQIPLYASIKEVNSYTVDEQAAIIAAASEDVLGDCYIFMLLTGLRVSELMQLRWENYDRNKHTIRIAVSKTFHGVATIAISDKAEAIILRQEVQQHGYIFSNTRGNPLTMSSMKKLLKRIKAATGIDVTNHKCRHTFCTRLVEAGADVKTVSTLARHSSVAFTMQRYVTSDLQRQRQSLSLLDRLVI